MELFSLAAAAVLGAAILYMLVALPLAIRRSVNHGQSFRDELSALVRTHRLFGMLGILGVDRQRYIANTRVVDIRRHLRNCGDCAATARCDADIASGRESDGATYCPNRREVGPAPVDGGEREAA